MDDFDKKDPEPKPDPFSREPIKTTYPGRETIGGGGQLPTRKLGLIGLMIAISVAGSVIGLFFSRGRQSDKDGAESSTPGSQGVPAETPVAGERDSRPAQTPHDGLDAPDPARGHMGSTSVDVTILSVSGGGRDRDSSRVEKALKSSYRDVAGEYMDYCRRRGVTEGRDEITLRFRVAPSGAVSETEVLSNSTADETVAGAARDAVNNAQFPPCAEEAFVTCKYVFRARMAPKTAGDR
jgi:hypothetical protein